MRIIRILRLAAMTVAVIQALSPAAAVELNLKASASLSASATVGLDDKTRALIATLPKDVRVQVMILIEQALPLIDISVQKYLDQVDIILDKQINHLECAVQ